MVRGSQGILIEILQFLFLYTRRRFIDVLLLCIRAIMYQCRHRLYLIEVFIQPFITCVDSDHIKLLSIWLFLRIVACLQNLFSTVFACVKMNTALLNLWLIRNVFAFCGFKELPSLLVLLLALLHCVVSVAYFLWFLGPATVQRPGWFDRLLLFDIISRLIIWISGEVILGGDPLNFYGLALDAQLSRPLEYLVYLSAGHVTIGTELNDLVILLVEDEQV